MYSLFYRVTHVPYLPTLVRFLNWHKMYPWQLSKIGTKCILGSFPKLAQNAFSVLQSDSCAISANFGSVPKLKTQSTCKLTQHKHAIILPVTSVFGTSSWLWTCTQKKEVAAISLSVLLHKYESSINCVSIYPLRRFLRHTLA